MNDRSDTEVDMPDEPSQQPDATAPDAATDTAAPAFTAAVERAVRRDDDVSASAGRDIQNEAVDQRVC